MTRRWIFGLARNSSVSQQQARSYSYSRLFVGLLLRVLRLHLTADDILPDIILLAQVEEAADLRRTLGTKALGEDLISEPRDLCLALLDDDERKDRDIRTNDAPAHGFALALASAARAVARVAVGEQQTHTVRQEHALLHREPLLVVSARDTENISLELVTERVTGDFLRHFLVVEDTVSALVVEIDHLLLTRRRVRHVELHGGRVRGGCAVDVGVGWIGLLLRYGMSEL